MQHCSIREIGSLRVGQYRRSPIPSPSHVSVHHSKSDCVPSLRIGLASILPRLRRSVAHESLPRPSPVNTPIFHGEERQRRDRHQDQGECLPVRPAAHADEGRVRMRSASDEAVSVMPKQANVDTVPRRYTQVRLRMTVAAPTKGKASRPMESEIPLTIPSPMAGRSSDGWNARRRYPMANAVSSN